MELKTVNPLTRNQKVVLQRKSVIAIYAAGGLRGARRRRIFVAGKTPQRRRQRKQATCCTTPAKGLLMAVEATMALATCMLVSARPSP